MAEERQPRHVDREDILRLARQYLLPHQPVNYRLEVLDDGLREEDEWWYVLVRPDRDDVRAYDYYSRLAEAEISLRDEENLNVLLVPALPD